MFLEGLAAVLLALIGGGIVNLIFELIRNRRRKKSIKAILFSEIRLNLKILDTDYLRNNPWIKHKSSNNFWEKHFNSIVEIGFNDSEIETITTYYNLLEVLKERDKENGHLDNLLLKGRNEGANFFQKQLGEKKSELRKDLIELSNKILNKK